MTTSVPVSVIKDSTKLALTEAFDNVIGMYLDKGDSLWETLESVSAAQASIPIAPGGNSIASQIAHMSYYFSIMEQYMQGQEPKEKNWAAAWQTVSVNEEEWKALKSELSDHQARIYTLIDNTPEEIFVNTDIVGGTYAVVAHTAFHLGQIKHALAAQGL